MAHDELQPVMVPESPAEEGSGPGRGRGRGRRVALAGLGVLLLGLVAVWSTRERIADNFIAGELNKMGLPATYRIKSIGPAEQVIADLVVGDPAHPDFTAKEVRIRTSIAWGLPGLGRITIVEPRLYGTLHHGKPSFGALDKVLFTGSDAPFEMPDLDVEIVDGRALIDSDFGRVGARLAGKGPLRGGFDGELAAIVPALTVPGCTAGRATVYGKLSVSAQKPRFKGPLRMERLDCKDRGLAIARPGATIDATFDPQLDGGEGTLSLLTGGVRYGASSVAELAGNIRASYRKQALTARYDLAARGLATPQARMATLTLSGQGRSDEGFARFDVDGEVKGTGVALGREFDRTLADATVSAQGTLVQPILQQIRTSLAREVRGSKLDAELIVRKADAGLSVIVPRGTLRGGSGASLLAVSRLQANLPRANRPLRLSGSFATGGAGLPRIGGRMEANGPAGLRLSVTMPEYRAGTSRIALPQLAVVQRPDGRFGFAGRAVMTGALPGGWAEDLALPIEGGILPSGDIAVWNRCTPIAFTRLEFANLKLDSRTMTICPAPGRAIVQRRGGVTTLAAGAPSIDLSGRLGQTPIRIASGPIGFAMPGAISARKLEVSLGPKDSASRFAISHLDARLGKDIAGTFDEADIALHSVPLGLHQTRGNWRYAGGVLAIDKAAFTLVDRQADARFQPLVARDATLRLADNRITAEAALHEPRSDRLVATTLIRHDLSSGAGSADLSVPGLVFDRGMQANDVSRLALGIVSDLKGTVTGTGRIDWNAMGVTSHGRFASDGLDFAAAFGPVQGVSGQVVFTDLLGLVTAPDQRLKVATMNPGIEVTDGELSFELQPGMLLQVNGGKWPFMDGTLVLEPAQMRLGVAETRRYTLRVTGLDAETFVQHLELANIRATGIFDGELPLVFDQNGGRIDGGYLRSRDPGGNVSYIGALTYKDLSAMGNFAFNALKSVNYRKMEIGLGGSLSGEILTRISFDGISQGAGASRNFLTKQVAKLPIRFVLNVKAPFFSLFGSMRSLYDPAFVTDPRTLGLVGKDGRRAAPQTPPTAIQPPVSEDKP